jgi:hypothetical protein
MENNTSNKISLDDLEKEINQIQENPKPEDTDRLVEILNKLIDVSIEEIDRISNELNE